MTRHLSRRDFLKASGGAGRRRFAGIGFGPHSPRTASPSVPIHAAGAKPTRSGIGADIFNEDMAGEANVVIEDFPGSEYFQKINTLAAGGTMGDVIWISSIEGYFRLAATGVLQPIDDVIESLGYDLSEHYEATTSAARLNGQLYGIPILAHPGPRRLVLQQDHL